MMRPALFDGLRDPSFPPVLLGVSDPPRAPLSVDHRADICIIGAGYTGLSAALHLARAGRKVIVLEAHRAGHGASGRNGGQLLGGQRQDQIALEKLVGIDDARKLWEYGLEATGLVKKLIAEGGIDCDLQPGAIGAAYHPRDAGEMHRYVDHLAEEYGYDQAAPLSREGLRALVNSEAFAGGMIDHGSGHLNPFAYAQGLAQMAETAGAVICENTPATALKPGLVSTATGNVTATEIILACNGYLDRLHKATAAHVMPINNFIAVTEPLAQGAALKARNCVADDHFVVNYFRTTADNRLVFGGGESYGARFPADIAGKVRKPMARIFPQLKDVAIEAAWGGTLAITLSRMPHFARPGPGMWTACGYSGHGIATATLAGKMIAQAIQGDSDGFDTMARVPTPAFPGGTMLRWPILVAAMTWYSLRDRLGV